MRKIQLILTYSRICKGSNRKRPYLGLNHSHARDRLKRITKNKNENDEVLYLGVNPFHRTKN